MVTYRMITSIWDVCWCVRELHDEIPMLRKVRQGGAIGVALHVAPHVAPQLMFSVEIPTVERTGRIADDGD